MVERSGIETGIRDLVAYDIMSKPLCSLGQKADRRKDKLAAEVARLLREGEEFERVDVGIERKSEEKARTLREGIDEFEKKYPNYGKILEGIIQEKRAKSNRYLCYKIKQGYNLGAESYRRIMKDLGLTIQEADAMYPHLKDISDRLGKAGENELRTILL